jgi:hypothetical protein
MDNMSAFVHGGKSRRQSATLGKFTRRPDVLQPKHNLQRIPTQIAAKANYFTGENKL